MKHIKVADIIEIILASDKKTTNFLTAAGWQIVNAVDDADFTLSTESVRILTNCPREASKFTDEQIVDIYNISSYDLRTLQYSTNKATEQKKDKYQKRLILSVLHGEPKGNYGALSPRYATRYYIRQSKVGGYFLESRVIKFSPDRTTIGVPIYNKIPDRYQSLLEDIRTNGKIY